MNSNITTQAKSAKKLALNKETVRQLSGAQPKIGTFGPTANCSYGGTCLDATCVC